METAEQYAALERFDQDPDLAELGLQLAEFNPFRLLGIVGDEEKHSRVLAWLLDPRGNHRLGDAFLKDFLSATTRMEMSAADWSTAQVQREWRNRGGGQLGFLDILIRDEGQQFLCAIENKVWSGEHSRQLTRYRQALEAQFPDFTRGYVFLSPSGIPAQDATERDYWFPVDYGVICQLIEKTVASRAGSIGEGVRVFLMQYVSAVRRGILRNEEARVLAWKIYRRHKSAIDYIGRERLDPPVEMDRILREVIRNQAGSGWKLEELHKQRGFTRFSPEEWQKFPVLETGTGWLPACPKLLLFQFRCQNDTLVADIAISESTEQAARTALDSCIGQVVDPAKRQDKRWINWIVFDLSDNILDQSDFEQWDENAIRSKIEEWVSAFTENEYRRIRNAVTQCLTELEASSQP